MRLNEWFTQSYRRQREEVEQSLRGGEPQWFVRLGDDLVLYACGHRKHALVRDAAFHRLKAEAHVPVVLHPRRVTRGFASSGENPRGNGAAPSTLSPPKLGGTPIAMT